MTTRATMWSVTINNPNADDEESINLARQKGWQVLGQLEVGENGTPHYQLAVKTPQVRFSALKKAFPRGHIEVAKSASALLRYVEKEATRAGDLPTQQDKYPSLSKYWDLVFSHLNGLGKDGLDYVDLEEGTVKFYDERRERLYRKSPLVILDECTNALIRQGYHVEGIGCNPNTRSQWKICSDSIILRSYDAAKNVEIETQQENASTTHRTSETDRDLLQEASCEEDVSARSVSSGQSSEACYE